MDYDQLDRRLAEIANQNITEQQKITLGMNALGEAGLTYDEYIALLEDNEEMAASLMQDPLNWSIGVARSLGQGILLGAGDEVEALIRSGFDRKQYEKALKDVQAGLKAFQMSNPGTALAFEIGGSFFTPGVGFTMNALRKGYGVYRAGQIARQSPTFMRRANQFGRELGAQATLGAGMGAGYALNTGQDVSEGAQFGAGASAALSAGMRGIGTVRRTIDKMPGNIPFGLPQGSGIIPPPPPPNRPSVTGDPGDASKRIADQTAIGILAKRALQEGKDFDEFLMEVDEFQKAGLGDEVTLFDLGAPKGEIQRTASGEVLNQSNVSRMAVDSLDSRQEQSAGRTIEYLQDILFPKILDGVPGPLPKDSYELAKLFAQTRKETADQLYEAARVNPQTGQENIITDPVFYDRLRKLHEESDLFRKIWQQYKSTTSLGSDKMSGPAGSVMTIKQFDHFKRFGLDEIANSTSENQRKVYQAVEIRKLKDELMEMVFNNPQGGSEYQLAVNTFSGDKALEGTYKLGQTIMKDKDYTPGRIRALVKTLSDDEKTYFKLGMAQGIIDRIRMRGDNIRNVNVKPLVTGANPESMIRGKLAAILGDDPRTMDQIIQRMDREGLFLSGFKDLLQGSDTAFKLANKRTQGEVAADMLESAGGIARDASFKNYPGLISRMYQGAQSYIPGTQRRDDRLMRKYGDAVGNRLFTKGADQTRRTVEELRDFRSALRRRMDRFPTAQPIQTNIEDYYLEGLLD